MRVIEGLSTVSEVVDATPPPRKRRRTVSYAERQAVSASTRQRADSYKAALQLLLEDFDCRIDLISREHGIAKDRVEAQVYRQAKLFQQRRRPNAWNAFVQTEMHKANQDRDLGERHSLGELVPSMRENYQSLLPTDRQELTAQLTKQRQDQLPSLVSDKSAYQTALSQLNRIDESLEALNCQHGLHSLLIIVRSSVTSYVRPRVFKTTTSEKFWNLAVKQDLELFALRLESFCIGGLHMLIQDDISKSRDLRGDIRKELGAQLVEASGDPKAAMCYTNYERDIVDRYGVVLEGWPFPTIRNLSHEGAPSSALMQLLFSLRTGTCYFRKLSELECAKRVSQRVEQAGGIVVTTSSRKVIGIRRGPKESTIHARLTSMNAISSAVDVVSPAS